MRRTRMTVRLLVLVVVLAIGAIAVAASEEALFAPVIEDSFVETSGSPIGGACPAESLRRISLCQKVLRTFLQPDPNPSNTQTVPFARTWSSAAICAKVSKAYPSVTYATCQTVAGHLYGAAGSSLAGVVEVSRKQDIQDVCVTLLAKPFAGATPLSSLDAKHCTLAATGGVTGLRALFLHGMGGDRLAYRSASRAYTLPNDGWLGRYPKYWRVEEDLDGIADVRYYVTDTTQRGWANLQLQQEYCAQIAKYNPHIVVTHSMGGPLIAAAIANKVGACTRISRTPGPGQVLWITSQSPWTGSPAADSTLKACAGGARGTLNKIRQTVIQMSADCPTVGEAIHSLSRNYQAPGSVQLSNLKSIARQYLSGNMCGISATPLVPQEAVEFQGAGLWALGKLGKQLGIVDWGKDAVTRMNARTGNDGLVAYSSCEIDGIVYSPTPASAFYVGEFSHGDGPCFVKDSPLNGPTKKPCNYLVNRAVEARTKFAITGSVPGVGPVNCKAAPAFAASYPRSFLQMEDAVSLEAYEARVLAQLHQTTKADAEAEATAESVVNLVGELASEVASEMASDVMSSLSLDSSADVEAALDVEAAADDTAEAEADAEAQAEDAAEAEEKMADA